MMAVIFIYSRWINSGGGLYENGSLEVVLEDENAVSEGDIPYFRKIYVVGDTDHIAYHGSDYAVTVQDFFYKFTVLERRDG